MKNRKYLPLVRSISFIYRSAKKYFDRELKPLNIQAGQVPILLILFREGGISQETIRGYFRTDKGTTAKTIKPLIREGYVVREVNQEDRRAFKIYLTEKGRNILPAVLESMDKWIELILENLKEKEKDLLLELLLEISKNIEERSK